MQYLQKNVTLEREARAELKELAVEAVAALGMLWGACDIGRTAEGDWIVLEVNAAPALRNERTLRKYVEAITAWASQAPIEEEEGE